MKTHGSDEVVLTMENICKRFGRLQANGNISLSLRRGEVLALLGENGAGKTTLMNILFGQYVADSGDIRVFGAPLAQGNTRAALAAGVGMVQQHFALAGNMSVLDNIVLGSEPLRRWRRDNDTARKKIHRILEQCGFNISPDALVRTLSVGERQKVEIMKVLYRRAKILVLDEPTAVLTPQEADSLFATVRRLTADGLSVILISHKLKEVLKVSDRICVLRRGQLTYETPTAGAQIKDIAQAMVGHDILRKQKSQLLPGAPLLRLNEIRITSHSQSAIDFVLCEREILGITGVSGNGQRQLCDVLCGLIAPVAGGMEWFGRKLSPDAADMSALGVARIPDDRGQIGVIGDMTVAENLISNRRGDFCRWGFFRRAAVHRKAKQLMKDFDVRCDSPSMPARLLSGGNMQKLIFSA